MVLSRNVKLLSGKEKMKRKRNSRRKKRHHSQTSCPCSFIFMDSDELGLVRQWLIPGSVGRSLPLVGTWFVVFLSATMSFQGMVHKGAIHGLWRQQKPKRIRKLVASQQSKGLESLGAKVCSPVNSCSVLSFKVVLVILKIFKVSPELNLYKKCSFVWHFEVPRAKVAPKERLAEPWTFLLEFIIGNRISTPSNKDICSIYGSHSQAVHCNHRFSSWEITLREAGKAPGSTKPKDDDEIEVAMAIGKVFHWKSTWVEI